jgi:uncharacterized protein YabN with tetrapyrrole methylase and pyrophosphatase domain
MNEGSLSVIGTGIAMGVHLTPQARAEIELADELHYLMVDELADSWIAGLKPNSHSLRRLYAGDRERSETYEAMVEQILTPVRAGRRVCAAFYGHPGIFAFPSHEAIRRARAEGLAARMLPAVSAEDCLFADLGIDPGQTGCQSYEATDFVVNRRSVDTTAALVLWQVSTIGERRATMTPSPQGLRVLADYLCELYPHDHEVTLYEASPYPVSDPIVRRTRVVELGATKLSALATLYVPPVRPPRPDPVVLERLGLATG